jgi:hypothetical protein
MLGFWSIYPFVSSGISPDISRYLPVSYPIPVQYFMIHHDMSPSLDSEVYVHTSTPDHVPMTCPPLYMCMSALARTPILDLPMKQKVAQDTTYHAHLVSCVQKI